MTTSSRFGVSSNASDNPAYLNGQRASYVTTAVERSGSLLEAVETRVQASQQNTSRAAAMSCSGEASNLCQSLISDLKGVISHPKFPRAVDLKRTLTSIVGIPSAESLSSTSSMRHLPPSSVEEIRRLKINLHESSMKARERVKAFNEATMKIEKHCHSSTRKRSRNDVSICERPIVSLPGGTVPKVNLQSHSSETCVELGPHKVDRKGTSAVPNRRIRTSLVETDARPNGIVKQSGSMNKDRDVPKSVATEEKVQAVHNIVESWEKLKMKKKRSVIKSDIVGSTILPAPPDGNRGSKRGLQQNLVNDGKQRMNDNALRSGANDPSELAKLVLTSQHKGIALSPISRIDQVESPIPNERRDEDDATVKASIKPNGREESCISNRTPNVKSSTLARGPRSNSGFLSKASGSMQQTGNINSWDHPQGITKVKCGNINHKRSSTAQSSSPPEPQCIPQRTQKLSRGARRSNLSHLIRGHDEPHASGSTDNDFGNDVATRNLFSNVNRKVKPKGGNGQAGGLSESEESGIADANVKDKIKKLKADDNQIEPLLLVSASKNSKLVGDDDVVDGVLSQGRNGRSFTSKRPEISSLCEKAENSTSPSQHRSAGSERVESKPNQKPTKKLSERRINGRMRHSTGESIDVHETLLAAAKAALDTTRACSGTFWKQIEPFFTFLSWEDITYLNKQICLVNEYAPSDHVGRDDVQHFKSDVECSSTPSNLNGGAGHGSAINKDCSNEFEKDLKFVQQKEDVEPLTGEFVQEIGTQRGISICQTLLSAIIEEEDIDNIDYSNFNSEFDVSHGSYFTVGVENMPKGMNFNALWSCHDHMRHHKVGINGSTFLGVTTVYADFQYNQMCISDRILLELSEIGLYPDAVPDLAHAEDEDIKEGMDKLETKLNDQVLKRKNILLKLKKTISEARGTQQKELEAIALNKLVEITYEKYMAYQVSKATDGKNVSKHSKHPALALVKQTLARCQKYEETGITCFSEPKFRDLFHSVSSHCSKTGSTDISADTKAANNSAAYPRTRDNVPGCSSGLMSKMTRVDNQDKFSDTTPSASEEIVYKEEPGSSRVKKMQALLDNGCSSTGSSWRASSGFGNSLVNGTKRKRSERDRDGKAQRKDAASRSSTAKIGRPAIANLRGERKNRTKPKNTNRRSQIPTVGDDMYKTTELPNVDATSTPKPPKEIGGSSSKDVQALHAKQNDAETMNFSNIQLSEIDVADFGGNGQDVDDWFPTGIEEDDGLLDIDFSTALDIPMDDLSQVNLML